MTNDGDVDIISSTDRSDGIHYPPMAVWNNEGNLEFTDVAQNLVLRSQTSGMGLGSNDLNKDGLLDYCISDVADHLICLMSTEDGFYLGGESLGLEVEPTELPNVLTTGLQTFHPVIQRGQGGASSCKTSTMMVYWILR